LIDPANFGELGILHTYGTFVTDKLANNRTLTVNGSRSALTVSGFSDVRYEYNPDVQNNPPPGLSATSASFDWEMSETAVSTAFTEGGEALLWASTP
jgi:hypothetical protein